MRKSQLLMRGFMAGASIFAVAPTALAQINCEAIPAGPARTDCYIGLARIGGGNAAIAGTKAQLARNRGALQQATGAGAKTRVEKAHKKRQ